MLPLLLAATVQAQAAPPVRPFVGLEWRPLSRQDLVFVDEGRTSGTAVGEFDGTVKPVLSAFGGLWFNRYVGLSLGVGVARITTTTSDEETFQQRHWGVVRPSLDLRFGWMDQDVRWPVPWFVLGMYGDVPSARDVSDGYTEEEQEAADETALNDRYRLGGLGGRAGAGVDYRILPGLMVGAQVTVGLHRSFYTGGDATFTSLFVATEASLLLTFEWPPGGRKRRGAEPVDETIPEVGAAPGPAADTPDPAASSKPANAVVATR